MPGSLYIDRVQFFSSQAGLWQPPVHPGYDIVLQKVKVYRNVNSIWFAETESALAHMPVGVINT